MTSVATRAKRRYRSADEDVEMFGSALDPKVVRRMAPYILPQKKTGSNCCSRYAYIRWYSSCCPVADRHSHRRVY